jgi:uncharacterized YccA/Bax inhibitor family protein
MIMLPRPWLREDTFRDFVPGEPGPKMTMDGAMQKTLFLMGCLCVGAWVGSLFPHAALTARAMHPATPWPLYTALSVPFFWPGLLAIALAIIGFIAWHSARAQVYLAPVFAFVEGMCLSSLALASNARYPGLGLMAALATCALLLVVVVGYWLGLVSDITPLALATAAVLITAATGFFVILVLRGMGQDISITGHATIVYWAIVLGFVVYLAQQLALGFKYIADAAELGAPQWMEWRAAFCLMVALVFIYITLFNILREVLAATRTASRPRGGRDGLSAPL